MTAGPPLDELAGRRVQPEGALERVVQACGGLGIRVGRPDQLPGALEQAVRAVRDEGRHAVINVLTSVS